MFRLRVLACLTVLALAAAACSGDRGEDTSAPAGGGSTTEADDGGDTADGSFGTLEGVCGPNEGGGETPDADESEILGVSDGALTLGTIADPGFAGRPGLNQEIFDAGNAFVSWCNEQGGINGREISLNEHDAALTEYQPAVTDACRTDFALVGSGGVGDDVWPDVGVPCDLVDFPAFSATPIKAGLAGDDLMERRTVDVIPNPQDRAPVGGPTLIFEEFPDAGDNANLLYGDLQTLQLVYERFRSGWESIGIQVEGVQPYSVIGEANWQPFALNVENQGASFVSYIGEPVNLAAFQQAMSEVGYDPEVTMVEANMYTEEYLDAAGASAEGTFIPIVLTPFEEADDNPATAKYIELVEGIDGKVAVIGVNAMSSWLLFATVAKTCDMENNLTRTCLLEEGAKVSEWDGGGLHAPTNPAENLPSECTVVLRVAGGAFERFAPDEGFACDPSYEVEVTPPSI